MKGHYCSAVVEFALETDEARHRVDVAIVTGLLLQEGAICRPQVIRVDEETNSIRSVAECLLHLRINTDTQYYLGSSLQQFATHLASQVILLEEVAVIHPQIDAHTVRQLILQHLL